MREAAKSLHIFEDRPAEFTVGQTEVKVREKPRFFCGSSLHLCDAIPSGVSDDLQEMLVTSESDRKHL